MANAYSSFYSPEALQAWHSDLSQTNPALAGQTWQQAAQQYGISGPSGLSGDDLWTAAPGVAEARARQFQQTTGQSMAQNPLYGDQTGGTGNLTFGPGQQGAPQAPWTQQAQQAPTDPYAGQQGLLSGGMGYGGGFGGGMGGMGALRGLGGPGSYGGLGGLGVGQFVGFPGSHAGMNQQNPFYTDPSLYQQSMPFNAPGLLGDAQKKTLFG